MIRSLALCVHYCYWAGPTTSTYVAHHNIIVSVFATLESAHRCHGERVIYPIMLHTWIIYTHCCSTIRVSPELRCTVVRNLTIGALGIQKF